MVKDVILILPALLALYWIAYALMKKKYSGEYKNAFLLYLAAFSSLLSWGLYGILGSSVVLDMIGMSGAMLLAPLYFMYVEDKMNISRDARHYLFFLPALIIILSNGILYGMMGLENSKQFLEQISTHPRLDDMSTLWRVKYFFGNTLFKMLFTTEAVIAFGWIFLIINRNLNDVIRHSDEEKARDARKNIRGMSITSITLICTVMIFGLIQFAEYGHNPWLLAILSMGMSMSVYLTGMFAFKYFNPDITGTSIVRNNTDYMRQDEIMGAMDLLQIRFEKYMEERPYCSPDFSLTAVSEALDTNRTYISELLNKRFGKSFSEFVSQKRIEYAISLIEKGNTKMKNVALSSGYQTMSTFYRNFQTVTGKSVPEWMSENEKTMTD